jgi:hypothetical protein
MACEMDEQCTAPDGVAATAACISTEQGMVCALACQDTPDCPAGMVCTYHTVQNVCGWTWN